MSLQTGMKVRIKTKTQRGTEKLVGEYQWLLRNAVKGGEKEMEKLKNWVKAHEENITFYDARGMPVEDKIDAVSSIVLLMKLGILKEKGGLGA